MALKHYTLYFKGKDENGNELNYPIISLELKKLDEYTSNYDGYVSLYNSLPNEVKNYIKDNLGYEINFDDDEKLKEHFFITDNDFNPIMDVVFEDDIDVLYINQNELKDAIIKEKMSFSEINNAKLKTSLNKAHLKYEFFKYLYETYVKKQKIACMIDTYDANHEFTNFSKDDVMIAAIATDKDNLMVLCKKLGQSLESRRNLSFKFKRLFSAMDNNKKILGFSSTMERKNKDLDVKELYDKIMYNLNDFKKNKKN